MYNEINPNIDKIIIPKTNPITLIDIKLEIPHDIIGISKNKYKI